jgi:hypothetical protein
MLRICWTAALSGTFLCRRFTQPIPWPSFLLSRELLVTLIVFIASEGYARGVVAIAARTVGLNMIVADMWLAWNRVFRPVYAWEEVLRQANRSTQPSVYHDFSFYADLLHIKRMELERKVTTTIIERALWPPTVYSWESSDRFRLGSMHQILL